MTSDIQVLRKVVDNYQIILSIFSLLLLLFLLLTLFSINTLIIIRERVRE
jgi:hypothetical protein